MTAALKHCLDTERGAEALFVLGLYGTTKVVPLHESFTARGKSRPFTNKLSVVGAGMLFGPLDFVLESAGGG